MKSLRFKILTGFTVVLSLVVLMSGISIYMNAKSNSLAKEIVEDDLIELLAFDTLRFNVAERIAVTRGYLLDGDTTLRDKFYEYTKESQQIEKMMLERSSEIELPTVQKIAEKSMAWGNTIETKVIAAYDRGEKELAIQLNKEARADAEELMQLLKEAQHFEDTTVKEMSAEIVENGNNTQKWLIVLSVLSIAIGVAVSLLIARMIVNPILQVVDRLQAVAEGDFSKGDMETKAKDEVGVLIHTMNSMVHGLRSLIRQVSETSQQVAAASEQLSASAEETSKATEQIAMSIQEVSAGSEQQASTVSEATGIVTEMSTGMNQVSDSIQSVASLTGAASEKATTGNTVVVETIEQMKTVQQQVTNTSEVINTLGMKSKEINQIVQLITHISSQTNLLALNAAIEAARAGEHGKGFAVVADEVRKLAEQSGQAAGEIRDLIQQIQAEVERAVASMNDGTVSVQEGIQMVHETGSAFQNIMTTIQEVAAQSQEVSTIVAQVNAGSQNMVQMMDTVAQVSQKSAGHSQSVAASAEEQLASMEEISASANTLSKMAEGLQEVVSKFRV